jgi:bifunctional ADP-heptose synthase (sugar kinase/adenylyltransferase)
MMAADSQASSQFSDISRFKGMAVVTPTEREARLALRDTASGLAVLAQAMREAACAENVVMTLGEDGVLVHGPNSRGDYVTDRLPALNSAPKDVAGAGDSLFASTSMGLCASGNVWLSSYLGEVVAAIQVSCVGNAPLEVGDVLREIARMDSH